MPAGKISVDYISKSNSSELIGTLTVRIAFVMLSSGHLPLMLPVMLATMLSDMLPA